MLFFYAYPIVWGNVGKVLKKYYGFTKTIFWFRNPFKKFLSTKLLIFVRVKCSHVPAKLSFWDYSSKMYCILKLIGKISQQISRVIAEKLINILEEDFIESEPAMWMYILLT